MKHYIHREIEHNWYEIFDTKRREQVERSTNFLYILNRTHFLNRQADAERERIGMVYEGRKSKPSLPSICRRMVESEVPKPEKDEIRNNLYPAV